MKKIRRGNDFVFAWEIERNGLPENLSSVLEKHLYLSVLGKRVELIEGVDYDITGNVIRIEVTPAIANIIGTYKAEFHYILPDNGLIDEDRKCAVDVDAFQIVARTAQADDPSEFTVTSDMAIAFKGDKGDSAYQVWLEEGNIGTEEDYFNWLQKPATDIAETVGLQEQARVEAENTRRNNEEQRVTAETNRQNNFNSFIEVSESAVNTFIGTAQGDINEAISNAETATENANTAATNADNARLAIQDDLALKANHGYDSSPKTLKQIDDEKAEHGYESIEVAKTLKQVETNIKNDITNKANHGYSEEEEPKTLKEVDDEKADHGYDSAPKTLKAVDEAKVDKTSIVGETGQGETSVMHQKAVTDELSTKASHGYESNPKTLKQVDDEIADVESDVKVSVEKPTAQSLSELNARITALEAILSNKIKDRIDVTKEFNVWGKTNLILYGAGANAKAPDFIGQKYIDTADGNVYVAVGTDNAGNWKLV